MIYNLWRVQHTSFRSFPSSSHICLCLCLGPPAWSPASALVSHRRRIPALSLIYLPSLQLWSSPWTVHWCRIHMVFTPRLWPSVFRHSFRVSCSIGGGVPSNSGFDDSVVSHTVYR